MPGLLKFWRKANEVTPKALGTASELPLHLVPIRFLSHSLIEDAFQMRGRLRTLERNHTIGADKAVRTSVRTLDRRMPDQTDALDLVACLKCVERAGDGLSI